MSAMDKFLSIMKLNDEEHDDYYNDDYYDDEDDTEHANFKSNARQEDVVDDKHKTLLSKVSPIRQQPRRLSEPGMNVCVIKPDSVEDAREITDTLLANRTVVLNLEGLDVDIAQRIIDFSSGSCFAIHGNLQKISQYIFIITPASVDISGDFQEMINNSLDVPSI
ncbi:MAG: cell division protein SepF [Lachnospiraceae bacterium]